MNSLHPAGGLGLHLSIYERFMKAKKIITFISKIIIGSIITIVVGTIAVSHFTNYKIVNPYVVQSGSMEPAIKTASVVFSIPQKNYNPGDVITFAQGGNKKSFDKLRTFRLPPIELRLSFIRMELKMLLFIKRQATPTKNLTDGK